MMTVYACHRSLLLGCTTAAELRYYFPAGSPAGRPSACAGFRLPTCHVQVKLWEVQESDEANEVGSAEATMDHLVRENQQRLSSTRITLPGGPELEAIVRNPDMLRLVGMTRVSYDEGREVTCRQS